MLKRVSVLLTGWLREPLIHFVLLGMAAFAVYHWVAPRSPANRIVLSESVIRGLRQDHLRRTGVPPTAEEEAALIQRFVDDEILYREALAEGLDRGDIIVRRRLLQKMEFLMENAEPLAEPSDDALQAYVDAHAERYSVPERVTLTHVFASADRHGDELTAVVDQWREQLLAGGDPAALGDPFLRGREMRLHSERELAAIFGPAFAAEVMTMPLNRWSAPVRSSYGLHLVRVSERVAAHPPALRDIRSMALRDWQEEQRADGRRAALARLRQHYDVRVEGAGATPESEVAVSR